MVESAESGPGTIDLFVHRPGELLIRVPRDLEVAVTATLRSNEQEVGSVQHLLQESAEVLENVLLILGGVGSVAAVIQLIHSVHTSSGGAPRIRYRRQGSTTTFEADGYDDARDVAKIIRALQEDLERREH